MGINISVRELTLGGSCTSCFRKFLRYTFAICMMCVSGTVPRDAVLYIRPFRRTFPKLRVLHFHFRRKSLVSGWDRGGVTDLRAYADLRSFFFSLLFSRSRNSRGITWSITVTYACARCDSLDNKSFRRVLQCVIEWCNCRPSYGRLLLIPHRDWQIASITCQALCPLEIKSDGGGGGGEQKRNIHARGKKT